jgi:hypothetical protein
MQERFSHQNLCLPQTQAALSTRLPLLEPHKPAHRPRTTISTCAIENVEQHKGLAAAELDAMELPCACELAALHNLLDGYSCTEWEEIYRYSFCLERLVEDSCTWHCTQPGM